MLCLIGAYPGFAWREQSTSATAGLCRFTQQRFLRRGGLQAGYSWPGSDQWSLGRQLHLLSGWTGKSSIEPYIDDTNMYFRSTAAYMTLDPELGAFRWLDLKAGVVSAHYLTPL